MSGQSVIMVMRPREPLWEALCERTCDLARFLEEVESAELLARETGADGLVRAHHLWRVRTKLPALLAPHLDRGLMEWAGRNEWQEGAFESRWELEPRLVGEGLTCEALMALQPAVGGRGTRVQLALTLNGGPRAAGLQAIAGAVVTKHFRRLVEAAERLLEEEETAN